MNRSAIAKLRLCNQKITNTDVSTAAEIVSWLGAVQAQDYAMAKWAIGLRLGKGTARSIEDEIDAGSIVRTHVLRPTWHFVATADIRWMLKLTAPRIQAATAHRQRFLELDGKTLNRAMKTIVRALEGGNHLTRAELMSAIERVGIKTDVHRGMHIMLAAELNQIVCNGWRRGKQFTYALMDERVPRARELPRDEALAKLAGSYFRSHGPATMRDFAWWSGLSAADARFGLESIRSRLVSEEAGGQTYWMQPAGKRQHRKSVRLLPAFDEFTVSYSDRSASVAPDLMKDVTVGHAIFRPIVVVDGRVVAIWIRKYVRNGIDITYTNFEDLSLTESALLGRAERQYRHFEDGDLDAFKDVNRLRPGKT